VPVNFNVTLFNKPEQLGAKHYRVKNIVLRSNYTALSSSHVYPNVPTFQLSVIKHSSVVKKSFGSTASHRFR